MLDSSRLNTRALIVLCVASLGWAFSFGLSAPLASLWLYDEGWGYRTVGYNTATYYFGIALAAIAVPWAMRRWGVRCLVGGCFLTGATVAVFPWCNSPTGYFVVRLINGIAGAMSLIPLETYINRDSPPARQSRNFGFYAFSVASGWALGNLVGLQMYADSARLAFLLGGLAAVASGVILRAGFSRPPGSETQSQGSGKLDFRGNIFSYGTGWCQGFLEGGMVGFLSLYLFSLGMNDDRVSGITSGIMMGVILFQVPVAWLADRFGRTRVLLSCYGVVISGLWFLPFCGDSGWLVVWLFLVGACSGAFYPLGLTILGERVPPGSLARANAWFLTMNCLGSLMGPGIMGEVMENFGQRAFFPVGQAAVVIVLVFWLATRLATARKAGRATSAPDDVSQTQREAA